MAVKFEKLSMSAEVDGTVAATATAVGYRWAVSTWPGTMDTEQAITALRIEQEHYRAGKVLAEVKGTRCHDALDWTMRSGRLKWELEGLLISRAFGQAWSCVMAGFSRRFVLRRKAAVRPAPGCSGWVRLILRAAFQRAARDAGQPGRRCIAGGGSACSRS